MLGSYNRLVEGAGFALLIAATLWDWLAARRASALSWIDSGDLIRALRDDRATMIDVRGPREFAGELGHVADALNLPVDELPSRLKEIDALKNRPVILVCRTDKRSAKASAFLRDAGFRDVRILRGGMIEWNRGGRPVAGRNEAEKAAAAGGPAQLSVGANQ
jgi:rhodanese-related sulfurtransferase